MPDLDGLFGGSQFISVLVVAPFVLIALIFLFVALRQRAKLGAAKRNWQTTMGQVLFSQVESRRSRSGSGYSTSYYPRVVYQYSVNGNAYQGSRVTLGSEIGRGSYNFVQGQVEEKYPTGRPVQVYYNPDNPSESALEMRAPSSGIFVVIVVVIVVILAITLAITAGGMGLVQDMIERFTGR